MALRTNTTAHNKGKNDSMPRRTNKKILLRNHSKLGYEVATDQNVNGQADITVDNNIIDSNDEEKEQANEVQDNQNETYNKEEHLEDNQAI